MSDAPRSPYPNYTERVVKARTEHRCDSYPFSDAGVIKPGDLYILATEFPGGESGYADSAGKPVSMRICEGCANLRQAEMLRVAKASRES